MPAMTRLRSLLLALGWVAAALLLALGAAGIATGVGGPPGTTARAELTWAADQAIRPGLAAAVDDLVALTDLVGDYSTSARAALVALVATDRDLLERSVAEGDGQAQAVASAAADLRAQILELPGVAPDPTVPFAADAELRQARHEPGRVGQGMASRARRIGQVLVQVHEDGAREMPRGVGGAAFARPAQVPADIAQAQDRPGVRVEEARCQLVHRDERGGATVIAHRKTRVDPGGSGRSHRERPIVGDPAR